MWVLITTGDGVCVGWALISHGDGVCDVWVLTASRLRQYGDMGACWLGARSDGDMGVCFFVAEQQRTHE